MTGGANIINIKDNEDANNKDTQLQNIGDFYIRENKDGGLSIRFKYTERHTGPEYKRFRIHNNNSKYSLYSNDNKNAKEYSEYVSLDDLIKHYQSYYLPMSNSPINLNNELEDTVYSELVFDSKKDTPIPEKNEDGKILYADIRNTKK